MSQFDKKSLTSTQELETRLSNGQMPSAPRLAAELLSLLAVEDKARLRQMRTTLRWIAGMLGKPIHDVSLVEIFEAQLSLRQYLMERNLKESTQQCHMSMVRHMLRQSVKKGCIFGPPIGEKWSELLAVCAPFYCDDICRYLALRHDDPRHITATDIQDWATAYASGRSWLVARRKAVRFTRTLVQLGIMSELPLRMKERYGIPLRSFPVKLWAEVTELMQWKGATISIGRRRSSVMRPRSLGQIRAAFSGVYGYAVNLAQLKGIETIRDLVTPPVLYSFVQWALEERKISGVSLKIRIVVIYVLLGEHPNYRDLDLQWLRNLAADIPIEHDSDRRERQAAKQAPYGVLEAIPSLIWLEREAAEKAGTQALAGVVQRELLMTWLIRLAWRNRNLIDCRISGSNPNLFKGPVPPALHITKPTWVKEALQADPDAIFWQFRFSKEETKMGQAVRALVPRSIVPLLEEFVLLHRPHLLETKTCDRLFLNQRGGPFAPNTMIALVSEQTIRYAGKRVTPHIFRHVLAYAYLEHRPEAYLTLSKILWHINVKTTLRYYGYGYDESSGTNAIDEWIETRRRGLAPGNTPFAYSLPKSLETQRHEFEHLRIGCLHRFDRGRKFGDVVRIQPGD